MADVEAAKDLYVNQWTHCGKRLTARLAQISCECGEAWEWAGTLGSTMECLETFETVHKVNVLNKPAEFIEQPGLF